MGLIDQLRDSRGDRGVTVYLPHSAFWVSDFDVDSAGVITGEDAEGGAVAIDGDAMVGFRLDAVAEAEQEPVEPAEDWRTLDDVSCEPVEPAPLLDPAEDAVDVTEQHDSQDRKASVETLLSFLSEARLVLDDNIGRKRLTDHSFDPDDWFPALDAEIERACDLFGIDISAISR